MARGRSAIGEPRSDQAEIQAVSRAARILELFSHGMDEVSVAQVAERLGLNRTTAHRYLVSLVHAGLLERARASASYIPGRLLVQLGTYALGRRAVVDLAPPHLQRVCAVSHLTTVLGLWGTSGVVVARVEEDSTTSALVTVRVGLQLPLTAAQSQLFLAFTADQLRADRLVSGLPPFAQRQLRQRIDRARATGVATDAPSDTGITAVAAPVFDEYGICATLALIGTAASLPADVRGPKWQLLTEAARALTSEVGGQPFEAVAI